MRVAFLVIGSALTSTTVSSHDRAAYAHTFSQNENVLFLLIEIAQTPVHRKQEF